MNNTSKIKASQPAVKPVDDSLKEEYIFLQELHRDVEQALSQVETKIKQLRRQAQYIADKHKQKEILDTIVSLPDT